MYMYVSTCPIMLAIEQMFETNIAGELPIHVNGRDSMI